VCAGVYVEKTRSSLPLHVPLPLPLSNLDGEKRERETAGATATGLGVVDAAAQALIDAIGASHSRYYTAAARVRGGLRGRRRPQKMLPAASASFGASSLSSSFFAVREERRRRRGCARGRWPTTREARRRDKLH